MPSAQLRPALTHIRAYSGYCWKPTIILFDSTWKAHWTVTMCWPDYQDLISKLCRSRNDDKRLHVYSREVELYTGDALCNRNRRIARCNFTTIAELNTFLLAKWGQGSNCRILFQRPGWPCADRYDPWMELTDLTYPKQLPRSLMIQVVGWITGTQSLGQKVTCSCNSQHAYCWTSFLSMDVYVQFIWPKAWHTDYTSFFLSNSELAVL